MPPTDSHAKREFAALKGRQGSLLLLGKVTKGAVWEGFSFPEKPGKRLLGELFFVGKVFLRDVFNVTFCGVQKVTKNTPRAAKRRCKIAALWTPGVRFKALHRHAFIEIEVVRV